MQQNLDRIWKCARWICDIITYARNREKKLGINLSHIIKSPVVSSTSGDNFGGDSNLRATRINIGTYSQLSQSSTSCTHNSRLSSISIGYDQRRFAKFYDPNEENPHSSDSISISGDYDNPTDKETPYGSAPASLASIPLQHAIHETQLSPSPSLSSLSTSASSSTTTSSEVTQDPSYAIIRVHAMYNTGLNKNVNIKLHITEQTTSRDIINLIVRHLNTVAQNRGKGVFVYSEESLANFCLVLKFQGYEKVLKDDLRLLQLRSQLQQAKVCVMMLDTMFSEEELGEATVV